MGRFRPLLLFTLLMGVGTSFAQSRYVVHFKDKNGSAYSVGAPEQYLSKRALDRRARQGISVTTADLPVNSNYIQEVKATGARVFYSSRWQNCALVQATEPQRLALTGLPFVNEVEYVAPGPHAAGRTKTFKNRNGSGIAGPTMNQLTMVGIDSMHSEGIRGEGVFIALLDAGYQGVNTAEPFQHLFANSSIQYTYDFVGASSNVYRYDEHGTEVFSIIAAHSTSYTGGAYEATFQLYVTEDVPSEYRVEEYNWLFAAERADSSGVDIIQASLGYNEFDDASMDYSKSELNGKTAVVSRAAIAAIERGIVVICSAGNEGGNSWGLVTPPADVNGILSVGSVTSSGNKSGFSSVGPTADSRIKPDVVAMGSGTTVIRPTGALGTVSGTSVAAPIITSLAAGIIQRFSSLTAQQVTDAIMESGSQALNPNNQLGYGIPYYPRIIAGLTIKPEEPITIYPNPSATGKYNILLDKSYENVEIQIYDARGALVGNHILDVTWANNPFELDLSALAAGSYLVRVKTKDNFKSTTLIRP
jgi:serine protease AprX